MPLIAAAVLAYVAGLLGGFRGVSLAEAVPLVGAVVLLCIWRRFTSASLAVILIAGVLVGSAAARDGAACRERALRAAHWRMVLTSDVQPGAVARGEAYAEGCALRASVAVLRGSAREGELVTVRGEALPTSHGIMVRGAWVVPESAPSLLPRLRRAARARIELAFGENAPVAAALLIADERGIEPAMRQRFAAAGMVHILAISGLHVGIIAAAAHLLLVAMRVPRSAAHVATLFVIALYVGILGVPPAALRAAVMLGVMTASRLLQRPTSPWAALAWGAAVPLADPSTVLRLGWQLSVAAMAGLIASGALNRRWITGKVEGWRAWVAQSLLASAMASLVTAPLVAWYFGQVSIVAPLANLLASPIVAVLQPALFLAMLVPSEAAARFIGDAAHPLLRALDTVAGSAAGLPYAALTVAPTLVVVALLGVAVAALLVASVSRWPARPLVAAAACATAALWMPVLPDRGGSMELHAIDVGQGDAIAIRTPRNSWILVDAGPSWRGGDEGRRSVVPYLRRRGGDVALFVLSHAHADHAGGAETVLRALRPRAYWDAGSVHDGSPYRGSLEAALDARTRWRRVLAGDTLTIDGVFLRVLAPDTVWAETAHDLNDRSVVISAQFGAVRFLLVGDAERAAEARMLSREPGNLAADVLKVGHHGSSTSSTPAFLSAVRPRLAVISAGRGNRYGHPTDVALDAIREAGAVALRTDRLGSLVVRTDGSTLEVEVGEDRWDWSQP